MDLKNIYSTEERKKSQISWIIEGLKETNFLLGNERSIDPRNEILLKNILEKNEALPVINVDEADVNVFDLGKLWPESTFIQEGKVIIFQEDFNPTVESIILYNNDLYDDGTCLVMGYFPT